MTFPRKAIAIQSYRRTSEIPLIAPAGSTLTVIRRDSDWPGWVWCKCEDGIEAWVPESWLMIINNQAALNRGYNSIELSFQAGEQLTLLFEESGWYWASNSCGDLGWVPANYVEIKPGG